MDGPPPAATSRDDPATRPPRRRTLGLSLRALMLLVLAVGGVLGWKARRISIQRRAVAVIRAAGGQVWYDHQVQPNGFWKSPSAPAAPGWLRRMVGDEPFQEVAGVSLDRGYRPADDAAIEAYRTLDRAGRLDLGSVQISEAQAARIASTGHLRSLDGRDAVLFHEGFRKLCGATHLEEFSFRLEKPRGHYDFSLTTQAGQTSQLRVRGEDLITARDVGAIRSLVRLKALRIEDQDWRDFADPAASNYLPHVAALQQLETLDLWDRCIGDDDFRRFAPLGRLERLNVDGQLVTDDGLAVAAGWPRLRSLSFCSNFPRHRNNPSHQAHPPRLTDAGLAHLTGCRRLETLSLVGARFADAGLEVLAGLPALRELELDGVAATPAGLGRLLAAHQFERLTLMGPGVADAVVPLLAGQKTLRELALIGPGVTDAAAPALARLPSLRSLDLHGTAVTDAGLAALAAAPGTLVVVDLRATAATPAGVAALRATRPRTQVVVGPPDVGY